MVMLRHVATLSGGGAMPLATVSDLLLTEDGLLYAAARAGEGMYAFDVSVGATPTLLQKLSYHRTNTPLPGFAPAAVLLDLGETARVVMPVGAVNGAGSARLLTATGDFGAAVRWAGEDRLPADLALLRMTGEGTAIGAARNGALMLISLQPGSGNSLAVELGAAPVSQAGGAVTALEVARLGGVTFALTLSAEGGSVVAYRLLPGLQAQRTALVDGQGSGIGFARPVALQAVTQADGTYVVVAGAGSGSLTVFRLTASGALEAVDHVMDTLDTRFQAVSVLETLTLGDRVFLLAAGADGGLSFLTLLPGGRLLHVASLADTEGMTLDNITAIAADGAGRIFVTSGNEAGLTRLTLEVAAGVVREGASGTLAGTAGDDLLVARNGLAAIDGGAGDDILMTPQGPGAALRLTGGAGQDVFVIAPGARQVTITDYQTGLDRIDLTLFPMLRSVAQVQITPTATGAILRVGDTVVTIITANGRGLTARDFTDSALFPLMRMDPALTLDSPYRGVLLRMEETGGTGQGGVGEDTLHGGAGQDRLSGGGGADLIYGGGGNDILRGESGNDTIEAGAGNDNIGGGEGDDLIHAISGANEIWGGLGHDTLQGGTGSDTIFGGAGRNQLFGNDGADFIFGGDDGDLIRGGAGQDLIRAGAGRDTIYGGDGNDDLAGGAGHDLIHADSGRNVVWGGLGDDTVEGGTGADTIYGGPGRNQLFGHDGDDFIFGGDDGALMGGGAGHDVIRGGAGQDTIYGGSGNDNIGGGPGNDLIYAGPGLSEIWGGVGNDTIHAAVGRDVLSGGPGADRFVFASAAEIGIGASRDMILDFTRGQDVVDLSALNARFNGTAGFVGRGAASFYHFASGGLLIGDQNGDGLADWVLHLPGVTGLRAAGCGFSAVILVSA